MEEKPNNNINNINNDNENDSILSRLLLEGEGIRRKTSEEINQFSRNKSIFDLDIKKNDHFINIILAKLDEIEKKSEMTFTSLINKYKECYDKYKKRIIDYLKKKEEDMNRVIGNQGNTENLLKYACHNIFNKINNLTEIYDNIINNIEHNFELLNIFLNENELINMQNPLEDFLLKNVNMIYHSSFLSGFNFEEINTTNISRINYYSKYLEYLNSEKINKPIKSFTLSKDNIEAGIQFIKANNGIKEIIIKDVSNENLKSIIGTINMNNEQLDTIEIKKFDFNFEENNSKIKNLKKVIIKNGRIVDLDKLSYIFINNNENLLNLSLEKVDMTNIDFKNLMENLYKSEKILNNLEYLSLSGNAITSINEENKNEPNSEKKFNKLKIFDLSKNDIYIFENKLNKFPELKLLDLSSNSIPSNLSMDYIFDKEKKILVLLNNNIIITNCQKYNTKYNEYLNKMLQKLDCDLKILNLSFTYNMKNKKYFEKLRLSPAIKISLIKLDLSYCGLLTEEIINFLKNNFGLFSLQKLNLNYNNIKSDIFEKLLSDEILLENLNVLDLSHNEIDCKEYKENEFLVKCIRKYTNLKSIKLIHSYFFSLWDLNISIDYKDNGFRKLYTDLLTEFKKNNRTFKIIIEDKEKEIHDKCFVDLFEIKKY